MTFEKFVEQVEAALFDEDEPGCTDQEFDPTLIVNEVGRVRLRKIWKELRDGGHSKE